MPVKTLALSFYFVFSELRALSRFRDFLDSWSDNYQIKEGILQHSRNKSAFQIYFTVDIDKPNTTIAAEKIAELVSFVSKESNSTNMKLDSLTSTCE